MKKLIISSILSLVVVTGAMAQNCLADFTHSVNSTNAAMISFNNNSTTTTTPGGSVFYNWNFDDGSYSTAVSPSHTYNSSGYYIVCLSVYFVDSMAGLSCSDTYCDTVIATVATSGSSCTANFYSAPSAFSPTMIDFTNTSTNSPFNGSTVSYSWDFGDGSTSSATNPSHTYAPGLYIACVTLDVLDSAGGVSCTDTYCDSVYVPTTGGGTLNCQASFAYYPDTTANPLTNYFVSTSSPSPNPNLSITYSWNFGDGSPLVTVSNLTYAQHTYAQAGSYAACLTITVTDSFQTCTDSYCDSVLVISNPPVPSFCTASFYVDSSSSNSTGIFVYNNSTPLTSSMGTTNYFWDFGDGNTSTAQFPTHQYASSGLYNLCLTIFAVNSQLDTCIDTYCHVVGVDSLGNVYFKTNGPGFTLNVLDPASIGLGEDALNEVQIYPNPSNGAINLDLGTQIDGEVSWSIYDLKGMNIANGDASEINTKIDVRSLNTGMYLMTVRSGNAVSNHKIQIVK